MTATPIRLFYWRPRSGGHINLGDELSRIVVEHVSGRPVAWSLPQDAEMAAIGSIIQMLYGSLKERTEPVVVWGAGVVHPQRLRPSRLVTYAAVRGPLTRGLAELPYSLPMGDPAILAPEIWPADGAKSHSVGIIPHYSQLKHPSWRALAEKNPRSVIIDVTDPDVAATIRTITRCERIASTSLHGLILADAYAIPSIWVKGKELHRASSFKFYDYFASVGRRTFGEVEVRNPPTDLGELSPDEFATSHFAAVAAMRDKVRAAFPAALRA